MKERKGVCRFADVYHGLCKLTKKEGCPGWWICPNYQGVKDEKVVRLKKAVQLKLFS